MRLSVNGEIVEARLALWPTVEYEATGDPGGAIGPGESVDLLRAAGVELVAATKRERAWLARHGFVLPERV